MSECGWSLFAEAQGQVKHTEEVSIARLRQEKSFVVWLVTFPVVSTWNSRVIRQKKNDPTLRHPVLGRAEVLTCLFWPWWSKPVNKQRDWDQKKSLPAQLARLESSTATAKHTKSVARSEQHREKSVTQRSSGSVRDESAQHGGQAKCTGQRRKQCSTRGLGAVTREDVAAALIQENAQNSDCYVTSAESQSVSSVLCKRSPLCCAWPACRRRSRSCPIWSRTDGRSSFRLQNNKGSHVQRETLCAAKFTRLKNRKLRCLSGQQALGGPFWLRLCARMPLLSIARTPLSVRVAHNTLHARVSSRVVCGWNVGDVRWNRPKLESKLNIATLISLFLSACGYTAHKHTGLPLCFFAEHRFLQQLC